MTFSTGSHKLVNLISVTSTWTSEEWGGGNRGVEGRKQGVEERGQPRKRPDCTICRDYIYRLCICKMSQKKKTCGSTVFSPGHPRQYSLAPAMLNFADRTRRGVFIAVWPQITRQSL